MKKIDISIARKMVNLLNKYIQLRNPETKDKWERNFSNNVTKLEFETGNGFKINLYNDSLLSKLIYCGFEDNEVTFITNLVKPGDIFFDIGANIGFHSLNAMTVLKNSGAIYAFEPTPSTYNRLLENIQLNNGEKLIHAFNLGLSDKNEKLMLNTSSNGHDAWNSFAKLEHVNMDNEVLVNVIRLDEFISKQQIEIDKISLIKIDVEGWELMVLDGMETLFLNQNFRAYFLIEFTEENAFRAGYSCRDIYNYMLSRGYKWFSYDTTINKLVPSPLKAYYPYENLIAVKEGQPGSVHNLLLNL